MKNMEKFIPNFADNGIRGFKFSKFNIQKIVIKETLTTVTKMKLTMYQILYKDKSAIWSVFLYLPKWYSSKGFSWWTRPYYDLIDLQAALDKTYYQIFLSRSRK